MTKPTPTTEEFEVVVREVKVFDQELANRGTPFFGGTVLLFIKLKMLIPASQLNFKPL